MRVLKDRGTQPTSGKNRATGPVYQPCRFCLQLLGGDSPGIFPDLAKIGATGKLAPPRACQVKLARLTDLYFLGCLLCPKPSYTTPALGGRLYPYYLYSLSWGQDIRNPGTLNFGIFETLEFHILTPRQDDISKQLDPEEGVQREGK